MGFVRANGIQFYYEECGPSSGEPIVFVAGLGAATTLWQEQLDMFGREGFRVLAFDNRGAGRTDKPAEPYSIPQFADDTAAVMDALGLESAHIYGESMGGIIAQDFAVRHARRVRTLVLGCTTFGGPKSTPPPADAAEALRSLVSAPPEQAFAFARTIFYHPQWFDSHVEEARRRWHEYERVKTTPEAYGRQLMALVAFDHYDLLPKITAPTLVINGENDYLLPVANSRVMAERIPEAELVLLPETGHLYFQERPEESARIVIDFIRRRWGK